MRRDWPGNGHVFFEGIGLIHEHVRPVACKALIVHHVTLRHGVGCVAHKRHRVIGVAQVLVLAPGFSGRIEAEVAARVEVKCLRRRGLGRPCIVTPPHVRSGLEYLGFVRSLAFSLQVMLEERKLDVGAKVVGRIGIELHIAQTAALAARPAAVNPGSLDERGGRIGVEFADRVEGAIWPREILRIVPAANH